MSKADGPGFVDKHIEKVVLLICLLVLLYALSQYGVSSKRTYEIAGRKEVPPKEVDKVLLEQAGRLEKRIEAQEPPEVPERNDLALLEEMQSDPLPAPQPAERQGFGILGVKRLSISYGLPLQQKVHAFVESAENTPPLANLVEAMPAPTRPVCWAGTELIARETPGLDGEREVKIEEPATWRAVSSYSLKDLDAVWQKLLRPTVIEPKIIALGYETEIQIRQPDGSWKTVDDVKPVLLPIYDSRQGIAIQPEPMPEYTGENAEAVLLWLDQFRQDWTEYQLQPDYYEVWIRNDENPSWEAHFPFEILNIYPATGEEDATETRKAASKRRTARSDRNSLLRRLQSTQKRTSSKNRDIPATPEAMGTYPPAGVVPPGRAVRRIPVAKKAENKEQENEPVEIRPDIPEYETQLAMGKILFWFHVNTIRFGREYRCRFRLVFANPLFTYDKDLEEENRKDAYVPAIKTKWSEWSEPICVKREVEYFLTGAYPPGKSVTVTVFTRWMDQPLKYAISKIKAGQRIRGSKRIKVYNPVTKEPMKGEDGLDPVIEFDTGAVAVQLHFEQPIEMIYLDLKGNLRSRSLHVDQRSERYKELEEEVGEAAAVYEPKHARKSDRKKKETKKKLPRGYPDPMRMEPGIPPPGGAFAPAPGRDTRDRDARRRRR